MTFPPVGRKQTAEADPPVQPTFPGTAVTKESGSHICFAEWKTTENLFIPTLFCRGKLKRHFGYCGYFPLSPHVFVEGAAVLQSGCAAVLLFGCAAVRLCVYAAVRFWRLRSRGRLYQTVILPTLPGCDYFPLPRRIRRGSEN